MHLGSHRTLTAENCVLQVVDEASLTGESDAIKKSPEEEPWCRSGTQVSEGSGRLLVIAVGQQSEWGKTMALVGEAGDEDTPLQEKLGDMAAAIGKVRLGEKCVRDPGFKWRSRCPSQRAACACTASQGSGRKQAGAGTLHIRRSALGWRWAHSSRC